MIVERRLSVSLGPEAIDEGRDAVCQACGTRGLVAFYEVDRVPTQTCVLLANRQEAAEYPTGDVLLGFCERCGFIQNVRFDLSRVDYSKPTEESQAFSPKFNEFADWLIDELMDRYDLEGKSVFEVGCGKGDFLVQLADRGIAHGLGIDPGYLPERALRQDVALEFRREWYGSQSTSITADFVLTRHLMEHVPNVGEFFGWLHESVSATPGGALFTEVPDVARVLVEGAYWDVYYEHCSYFTLGSLARTLRGSGFDVDWLQLGFEDQYLLAGARPSSGSSRVHPIEDSAEELSTMVDSFAEKASVSQTRWRQKMRSVIDRGGGVAIWGGASKAVAFLSSIGINDVTIVDINPYRQGQWLPGIGVEIEPPEVLLEDPPDLVVPMNPIYVDEITGDLRDMGLSPDVTPVTP